MTASQVYVFGEIRTVEDADKTFARVLPLAGTRSPQPGQRRKLSLGTVVKVPGLGGWAVHTVLAVSADRQSWRDEDGGEHLTCDILL